MTSKPELSPYVKIENAAYRGRQGEMHRPAVGPITLTLASSELLSILGPPGCGKGTLLRMIAGLVPPTSGQILIAGQAIGSPRTDIGIVFDSPALLPWRTALENILLQGDLRKLNKRWCADRARLLLASLGLSGYENYLPSQLPEPAAVRVSICRALVHDPSLLLMDDPFHKLDPLSREQTWTDLQRLWITKRTSTILATSHITEAVHLSDRVAVIASQPGRLVKLLDIDLPRPRRLDKAMSQRIVERCNAIRTVLQAEGVLP